MFYRIFRWIGVVTGFPFYWVFFTVKRYYENENAKKKLEGGALIIQNHYSPLDFVISCFLLFPRRHYVVASEDAFRNDFMRFLMKFWCGIEANRKTKSVRFMVESVKRLKEEKLVLIYPEGHNTDDGTIKAFYPSYILIALRAKKPIVPMVTDGAYSFFKRTRVIFGEPIDLYDYLPDGKYERQDIDRLNDIVRGKVLALREQIEENKKNEKNRGTKP